HAEAVDVPDRCPRTDAHGYRVPAAHTHQTARPHPGRTMPPGGVTCSATAMTTSPEESRSKREMARSAVTTGGHWVGYGWFMSFGTVIPLLVFLGGYVV